MQIEDAMLHVAQAVRFRFIELELESLRINILSDIAKKYPHAPTDANLWKWISSIVKRQVEAIDVADEAYALSASKVRNILEKIQSAYYNATCAGKSEADARQSAWFAAKLALECNLSMYD